ncbi:ly6/PLAUR domain-containing protein 1 isoform X5 [Meriones unguiculatus]|uniref:ly6/PLAUR domain-containing protein 1 isoform X5 n=1 Tax=Meriones unguiculatus TaxID=10047 RepID=UPI00293F35E3|nr:ly6/PLAUR domain-containing protein 1 isoform X5 [Meriones unguiculatus]
MQAGGLREQAARWLVSESRDPAVHSPRELFFWARRPELCQCTLQWFTQAGLALQIQCYQCEEFQLNNDCSSPEFIVNCTVNVQDMCQKEVMEQSAA